MTDLSTLRLVLDRIAVSHAVDPECLSIGDKGAVFYRNGDELLCSGLMFPDTSIGG